jgi:hypothetical protein
MSIKPDITTPVLKPSKRHDNSTRGVFARSAAARALIDAQRCLAAGDFRRAEACAVNAHDYLVELSRGAP